MPAKTIFLDRDKTIIRDPGYLDTPSLVSLLPGVTLAMKSLAQAGYKIIVISNQSGVARGIITEDTLREIHDEMCRQVEKAGAHIDAIYYCPFHPDGTVEEYAVESDMRKPAPGMLLKAAKEFDIDLAKSWMIGDKAADVEAGKLAGCRTVRIVLPKKERAAGDTDDNIEPDFRARNLIDAARIVVRESALKITAEPTETQEDIDPDDNTKNDDDILAELAAAAEAGQTNDNDNETDAATPDLGLFANDNIEEEVTDDPLDNDDADDEDDDDDAADDADEDNDEDADDEDANDDEENPHDDAIDEDIEDDDIEDDEEEDEGEEITDDAAATDETESAEQDQPFSIIWMLAGLVQIGLAVPVFLAIRYGIKKDIRLTAIYALISLAIQFALFILYLNRKKTPKKSE